MWERVKWGEKRRWDGVCWSVYNMLRNRCNEREKENWTKKHLWIEDKFLNVFSLFTEVKTKLSELVGLYDNICQLSTARSKDLEDTLEVSEKFWEDYNNLCSTVKDLQDQITSQDPPALEPAIIREQQDFLEVMIYHCSFTHKFAGSCFYLERQNTFFMGAKKFNQKFVWKVFVVDTLKKLRTVIFILFFTKSCFDCS